MIGAIFIKKRITVMPFQLKDVQYLCLLFLHSNKRALAYRVIVQGQRTGLAYRVIVQGNRTGLAYSVIVEGYLQIMRLQGQLKALKIQLFDGRTGILKTLLLNFYRKRILCCTQIPCFNVAFQFFFCAFQFETFTYIIYFKFWSYCSTLCMLY